MHDMITSGSMAAASRPGFFTQEEARATEAVAAASRGGVDGLGDATQDVDEEEEEQAQVDEEDDAPEPTSMAKGRKKRKKNSPPTEPRIKWTGKEEECLAEAWKTVSMKHFSRAIVRSVAKLAGINLRKCGSFFYWFDKPWFHN
jgi:hypothetical protein